MMRKVIVSLMTVLCGLYGMVYAVDQDKEGEAVNAAQSWLAGIDVGNYSEAWNTAAGTIKTAVTLQQWEQTMSAVRRPLGKLTTREIGIKQYLTSLPGAPDGEYVIIQFKTSFEFKKAAVETVTVMREKEGIWRVSGYYIQ